MKLHKKILRNKFFALLLPVIIISQFSSANSLTTNADAEVKVPILLYHNITTSPNLEGNAVLNISPEMFTNHMQSLKSNGWNTISFEDYYAHVVYKKVLPNKPVIITFDDGYTSNYTYAYPILKELDMKATIFTVTDRVGAQKNSEVTYPHFTWEQAREMEESGVIDIESHSNLHQNMSETENLDKLQTEFRRSKYLIEKNLNKDCNVFAFPYGGNNDFSRNLGNAAGYKILCLVGDKGANSAGEQLDRLKRITVSGDKSSSQVIELITENLK